MYCRHLCALYGCVSNSNNNNNNNNNKQRRGRCRHRKLKHTK